MGVLPDAGGRLTESDCQQLDRALQLATQAIGLTEPNPRVGCIIHGPNGQLAGQGHTQQAGGPHAEVMALRDARQQGLALAGGTAWVSLEPCAHQGRTAPCCDALIAAGLKRVVVTLTDPYPLVAGQGVARMRSAGIEVIVAPLDSATARAARALNVGFLSRVCRSMPWVRLKVAASLDGRTALSDGQSQWITGPQARADGHAWRRRAGAILTGIGTVRRDDPRLDVRLVPTAQQPMRVVVDSQLRISTQARVLQPPGRVMVVGAQANAAAVAELRACGAELRMLPASHGRVDLKATLQALAAEGVNELHVEAGATLNGALLEAGLVDELLLYLAPCLIGPGRFIAELAALGQLTEAPRLRIIATRMVGEDLLLRALTTAGGAFLN